MKAPGLAGLRARVAREAAGVAALTVLAGTAGVVWDLPRRIPAWSQVAGEVLVVLAFSHVLMLVFGARRGADLKAEFTRRTAAEARLREQAVTDDLTGLLNRRAFTEALDVALAEAGGTGVSVALLGLDRFSGVNDALGHAVGDALLRSLARRLADELAAEVVLGRTGGDEFALLLGSVDADAALALTARAAEAVRRPLEVDGLVLEVEGSAGVALAGTDGGEVLRAAHVALCAAKEEGRGTVVHTPALDRADPEQVTLFGELRRGIRDGELRVHYQPQADLRTGRVHAVEALVRWDHPRRGLLQPGDFIGLAEHTGLVRPLTEAVLGRALADCARWRAGGLELRVAVNLSARGLLDAGLPERVPELLRAHGLPASALELEITESAALVDPGRAITVLNRLRDLGVRLAVDDYGTGHASLSYLSRLPVTTLKIDRSFVSTMELDRADQAIVRSTVHLAHELGLRVVAEGVETRSTWAELQRFGCDEAQGFWLAPPCPAEEVPVRVAAVERAVAGPAPATISRADPAG